MLKVIVFAICGCLLSWNLYSQSTGIDSILQNVEQNNTELKALASYVDSRRLELKSGNHLPGPEIGGYYLPFGDLPGGNYSEFQVTQSFEFPSVYGARADLIDLQSNRLQLAYQLKRQSILAEARGYCIEIIFLNKRRSTELNRLEQAEMVFEQVQELYAREQVGILELNKARVAWMQEQFSVQQVESEKESIMLLLQNLNGGDRIEVKMDDYQAPLALTTSDSLWQDRMANDPYLEQFRQEEAIAKQQLTLKKKMVLPDLTAGFNHQGVSGAYASGFYAGVSIPLWSNRNRVKGAQSHFKFQEINTTARMTEAHALLEKQYNDYLTLLVKFREYRTTLSGLNSDALLLQAYQLGEISFMEYYLELEFYRQAIDAMLEMEHQLYQLQAEILKYQL